MIKIGIDPSGSGTTAIVMFKNGKLMDKYIINDKNWIHHFQHIQGYIKDNDLIEKNTLFQVFVEDCLYTSAAASKDRDSLLRLCGVIEYNLNVKMVSPKYTKSIIKNMENLSKYNDGCIQEFSKDNNLTYEYGKGWKYNNEKISNHLRDAIIIANYKG